MFSIYITTHLAFFNVKLPGIANLFNNNLMAIANFEIIDIGFMTDLLFYFPDEEPFSLPLQRAGYDTKYLMKGLGIGIYSLALYLALIVV